MVNSIIRVVGAALFLGFLPSFATGDLDFPLRTLFGILILLGLSAWTGEFDAPERHR